MHHSRRYRYIRIALILLFLIVASLPAVAEDLIHITSESIETFVQLFPQYKQIVEQYENDEPDSDIIETVVTHRSALGKELDALFKQYSITVGEFTQLLQKVTIGYTTARMQQQDISNPLLNAILQSSRLSSEEQDVIKTHLPQLEKLFIEE
ncbi:MAG: hypothetical protein KKH94_06710 [Candidatus Omnitrophica bacterium]|nr:hypothetical protein [Candidatus Omnitrophota bacterium]